MKDLIERIKEEIERGESSLDTLMRVFGALKSVDRKLYEEFATEYEMYANDEGEMTPELIDRVYGKLEMLPDPEPEKPLL